METDEIRGMRAQERFKKVVSTARVIGPEDKTQAHIVLTWWSRLIAITFGLLLLAILGLLFLVYANSQKIQELEIKVDESNTQNFNRR